MKKLVSVLLVLSLLLGAIGCTAEGAEDSSPLVIDVFKDPGSTSRPMARMWFPDAGAGEDENDLIEKQILELADKGFGGVEVAMLADGVRYSNEEGRVYGWGTDNWIALLKKVLKAAAKVDGGFQVDMTISAHWPPAFNTIDPNDDAASKQLSYSITPLSPDNVAAGTIELALPEQQVNGPSGTFGPGAYSHFLFTDTFVAAYVAKIAEVKQTDAGEVCVIDFDSVIPITDAVSVIDGAGYAAGVPDKATSEAYGWDYEAEICSFFGPDPTGTFADDAAKLDENGDRKRMADRQDMYAADLSGIEIDGVEAGDTVILSTFERGTGQSISGGHIMANGVFITSYFNEAGTAEVTGYWDSMFERDPELKALMQANPGYIFEDSIESSATASYWAAGLEDDMDPDYAYADVLPLVAASKYISSGFMGTTTTVFFEFDDAQLTDRIYEDYNELLADKYVHYRVTGVGKWADETLGWGFRGQTYHLPGLEIGAAAQVADVPECDNMSKGDGVRYQAGTRNITGKRYLTMEAVTGPTIEYATLDDVLTELGQNYSDGVSRAILHGTPYARTFNGYNSDWPGWLPFGPSSFGSAYTYRQAWWDEARVMTDTLARIQSVIGKGQAKIDLAVLVDKMSTFDFESGNRFQNLLDMGFSYNLVSESTMTNDAAVVTDGMLCADGPAYKALIVDRVHILGEAGMARLTEYAEAGLPIVIYDSAIERVYGSDAQKDADVSASFEALKQMTGVAVVSDVAEIPAALESLDVGAHACYDTAGLETTLYRDKDGTNYYYCYNNAFPENSGMMGNTQGLNYKGEDKAIKNAVVTLEGNGVPYRLDPRTGEIAQIGAYTAADGKVTFTIDALYGGDSVIYAVTENTEDFPAAAAPAVKVEGGNVAFVDGTLCLKSTGGDYKVETADGTTYAGTAADAPNAIDLSGEAWDLVLDSYAPDGDAHDPSVASVTSVDLGAQTLGKWRDISVTEDQLAAFGVDDMRYVSGTGKYTLTFITPDTWTESTGSVLAVSYGCDQIKAIVVNGTKVLPNNASDHVDLGLLIVPGENIIEIEVASTLYGRMYAGNSGYADADFGMGAGFMAPPDPDAYYNGLLGATLEPYTIVELK